MKDIVSKPFKVTDRMRGLLKASGSYNEQEAARANTEIAKAFSESMALREGLMSGDIIGDIFTVKMLEPGQTPEFPLHFLAPGTEKNHVAYTIPNQGYIPQRNIQGDYVMVPTYPVGNSIDWMLRYARDGRWDIISAARDVYEAGFIKKFNDDGVHVLLAAAADRNIVVSDSDAADGQFTKRLVSLMKLVMRRNGGGNSTSNNRGRLTDLAISPEAMEDIRNWNVDQVDEITRREIMVAEDGSDTLSRIFGVNLRDWDELGEGQEYQLYLDNDLSVTLPGSDVEAVLGLDLSKADSLISPVREDVKTFDDPVLHRSMRAGVYGWAELGFAALDGRRVILGSL